MEKKHFVNLSIIIGIYLLILFFFKQQIFTYQFDHKLINRYFCSQDIPYEPNCPRVWLSDEELHIAAGYLYATGSDPAEIDFQHMPLIAYLYGFSVIAFNNPYYVEIIFGVLFLSLVYLLGIKIYKSEKVSIIACLLFLIDPLFLDLSSQASYELGQAVLILLYFYFIIFHEKNFLLRGITLGLIATSKFWGAALFFVMFFNAYKILTRNFKLRIFILSLITGFITFSIVYFQSYILRNFQFNIVFLQLKILKYWLTHSITNIPFASLILFTTGFFKSWWDNHEILRTQPWSIIWPVSLLTSLIVGLKLLLSKKFIPVLLVSAIPFSYLVYLGVQAPFSRYFILILPFSYLSFAKFTIPFFIILKKHINIAISKIIYVK